MQVYSRNGASVVYCGLVRKLDKGSNFLKHLRFELNRYFRAYGGACEISRSLTSFAGISNYRLLRI